MSKYSIIGRHRQHLQKEAARERDFIDRNYGFVLFITFILYPLALSWSIITEGGNIYTRAMEMVNNHSIALGATILIILLIEGGVIVAGMGASNDLTDGAIGAGSKDRSMFFGKLLIFSFCSLLSWNFSFDGSDQGTRWLSQKLSPPTEVSLDSIKNEYQQRIARQEAIIADARTMTWQGRITRKGSKIIDGAQTTIAQLELDQETAVRAAEVDNEDIQAAWDAKTEENAGWAWYVTGLGQIIMLFCIIIRTVYKSGENNLMMNLENLTNTDINGDGHVGKPDAEGSSSPTPDAGGHEAGEVAASALDEAAIAAAVAAELDRRAPKRRSVPFMGRGETPAHKSGPVAETGADDVVETEPVEAVPAVPQQSQPDTIVETQFVEKTVQVDVGELKKQITTYYPRCFSKKVAGKKGSARPSTIANNRQKVEAWVEQLEKHGIAANVNYEYYTPITWKTITTTEANG
jgi:hypothetical protein